MKLINHGITSVKHDLQELIEGAQAQRSVNLDHLRSLQLATQLLVQHEAQRLARRDAGDARITRLSEIERKLRERVTVLDTEREIAAIRVPPVTKTGALIHGRVTDSAQRAAGGMQAVLMQTDGKPVEGVPAVNIDASGYYAFVLDEKQAAALGDGAKLQVVLQSADAKIAPAGAADITLKAGTVAAKDVMLNDKELAQLNLRQAFAPAAAADGLKRTTSKTTTAKSGTKPKK